MPSRDNRPEPNHEALRLELARLRAEQGLTYEALADRSGLSRTGLINLEHGTTRGSLDTWFHVARALGVPIGSLIEHLGNSTDRLHRRRK